MNNLKEEMLKQKEVAVYRGPGFITLLTLVFIVLKLIGVINWSWWWVLAPLWIPFGIVLVLVIIISIIVLFTE